MNVTQKQQVLDQIAIFKQIDLKGLIAEANSSEPDFDKISFGEYSASAFLSACNRVITQLENELERGLGLNLPFQYNFHNEFGNGNLQGDISNINSLINSKQFQNAIPFLNRLIYYEILNGFWDKSAVKAHPIDELILKQISERLDLISQHLSEYSQANQRLIQELESEKNALTEFFNQRKEELNTITKNLQASNDQVNQINTLVTNSSVTEEKTNGIYRAQNDKLEEIKKAFEIQGGTFNQFNKTADELKQNLIDRISNSDEKFKQFEENLKYIEDKKEFIDQKQEEIIKLTGFAADASLGYTFNRRSGQLEKSVKFWRWAVPAMTVITLGWVAAVFTQYFSNFNFTPDWNLVLMNIVKTLPMFAVLGFVIAQYSRERSIQEEYAFKSAVAMTITAYADKLNDPANKEKMIIESIQKVYEAPKIHGEKTLKKPLLNSKRINESIDHLIEVLKQIEKLKP